MAGGFCGFCVVLGSGSACYLALVGLSEHYVGTRARGRAPIQSCDDDNTPDTTVFGLFRNTGRSHRSSGHLLMLLLMRCHKNNIRLFIGVIVLLTLSYYTAATVC